MPAKPRNDWTLTQVQKIYDTPLLELIHRAATVHRQFHDAGEVQVCKLISIKTGGCPEDCSYCPQSARYQTEIKPQPLMPRDEVMEIAQPSKASGVTRDTMGPARREGRDHAQLDRA